MMQETHTSAEYRKDPRIRGKRNREAGEAAEYLVRAELYRLGYHHVERIHTGWKVQFDKERKPVRAWPLEKVAGDFRAIGEGGQSVLVEVKSRSGRLPYSALEKHQIEALDEHHRHGGLSLLAWYDPESGRVSVWEWPVEKEKFGPGKSLRAKV